MVGLLKRYRELIVIAVLLIVPLGVYFAHARAKHPSERSGPDRAILLVGRPVEWVVSRAVGGVLDGWNGYVGLRHAHQRAGELEAQVNRLLVERAELERERQENERLRRLLGFAQAAPSRRLVGASVIGVRLDPKGLQLVTIDRGSNDGIDRMMPVVVGQGVVGRVYAAMRGSAEVLLLSDRNSSIAVRVDRSRARANVRGTGSPYSCGLEYALRSDDFVEGDVLVTSGTDGVFPRGLPVGKLVGVKRGGQGLYQRADVAPAVDVTKLEEVLVLLDRPPALEEEPVAQAQTPGAPPRTPGPTAAPPRTPAPAAAPPRPAAPARATATATTAPAAPAPSPAPSPGVQP